MKQKGFTKVFTRHLEVLASSKFAQSRFSKVSSFFSFIEFVLELSVFGHVAVSSFFLFFSRSLELLDLELKLFNLSLKTREILFVFFTSISGFLDLAFKLANRLLAFGSSSLFGIKLRFEFTNARFKFLNLLLTALQGNLFSFIET